MTRRQDTILRAAVREHIRTAEPVASAALGERFCWSSATIRAEFGALERAGYLAQTHASGGRVPTTSGYRYYVDHAEVRTPTHSATVALERLRPRVERVDELLQELAQVLAHVSGTLAVVAGGIVADQRSTSRIRRSRPVVESASVSEAGFSQLFSMQEFDEHPAMTDLGRLLDRFERPADVLATLAASPPRVYIDGENPLAPIRRVSMVTTRTILPSGTALVAALIGPVRMPYERHLGVMEALQEALTP